MYEGDSPPLSLGVQRPCKATIFAQNVTASVARGPAAEADRALGLPTWMTAGNPSLSLTDLPVEILEGVVLRLHAQEILKLRIVRAFSPLQSPLWFRMLTVHSPPPLLAVS